MADLVCATCGKKYNGATCECGSTLWSTQRVTTKGETQHLGHHRSTFYAPPEHLIESFRKRPGMYMGKKSINLLQIFLCGVECAEGSHNVAEGKNIFKLFRAKDHHWMHFEGWIASKYGNRPTKSFGLALEKSEGDEAAAFDLWFKWFDEFAEKYPET